jgi:nitroreductase
LATGARWKAYGDASDLGLAFMSVPERSAGVASFANRDRTICHAANQTISVGKAHNSIALKTLILQIKKYIDRETAMQLKEAIEKRASIRKFSPEKVAIEDLTEMVRRAGLAPSVNNEQPWKFIAILNTELLQSMAGTVQAKLDQLFPDTVISQDRGIKSTVEYYSTFFKDAPVLLAVLGKKYEAMIDKLLLFRDLSHEEVNETRNHPDVQSIGAAVQNLLLSAVDLGYGACWLSGMMVARNELEELLHIEAPWHLAAFVAVGKATTLPRQRDKKSIDEIFSIIS